MYSCHMISTISVDDVKNLIDSGEKVTLVDVRTLLETQRGYIPNSLFIPLDKIKNQIEEKIPQKESKIILYCLSGSRSSQAAEMMSELGYKNVFSMENGLLAWRIKKYPLSL